MIMIGRRTALDADQHEMSAEVQGWTVCAGSVPGAGFHILLIMTAYSSEKEIEGI